MSDEVTVEWLNSIVGMQDIDTECWGGGDTRRWLFKFLATRDKIRVFEVFWLSEKFTVDLLDNKGNALEIEIPLRTKGQLRGWFQVFGYTLKEDSK